MAAERKKCLITLKLFVKKLQDNLQVARRQCEGVEAAKEGVPGDVKEGHFVVLAKNMEEEKPIRFVVELCVLKLPAFVRLLKLAEEEYGFQHRGAVKVPCPPEELRKILQQNVA